MRSLFLLLEARLLFPCTEMEFFHFYISYFWRRICVCFGFFFSLLLLYFASLVPCHVIHFPLVNFAPVYIRLRSGFMCRFDDFNHLMSFWAVRQCLCVCECMYIHFTNLTIIITKEKLLTAKYTEFYTLTALHNVCHAFFFIIMFSSVTGCQLQHRAHIYCRTLHLVDFVLEFHCVCVCVLRSVHFQCNRIESISVSLCFVVVFLRGKRQMPSQCSGQIKKIAIFIWTTTGCISI